MAPARVAVIGGGVAGLMCATRCQEKGLAPIVFDTGKNTVGGRASSRLMKFEGADGGRVALKVDHAAQFFVAQREAFTPYVARWAEAGAVQPWDATVGTVLKGSGFRATPTPSAGTPLCRWVAAGGMGELWEKHVAAQLSDVRRPVWVSALERTASGGWRVMDGNGALLAEVEYVVIAHNGKCVSSQTITAVNFPGHTLERIACVLRRTG